MSKIVFVWKPWSLGMGRKSILQPVLGSYIPMPYFNILQCSTTYESITCSKFLFYFSITSKRSYGMSFIKKSKHINKSKHSACGIAIFADLLSYELMNSFTLKKWRSVITWRHNSGVMDIYITYIAPQDEFLDVIRTQVLSFPPWYSQSPLQLDFTPLPPPELHKVVWNWFVM
jgi:hypothetical protein